MNMLKIVWYGIFKVLDDIRTIYTSSYIVDLQLLRTMANFFQHSCICQIYTIIFPRQNEVY